MIRLKERFPLIQGPPAQDICYATENRQMAVKAVAAFCDLLLVVGSQNSSNSKRLVEVGENTGVRSYLVNDWSDVDHAWLDGVRNVAVTAGASAPEHLVSELIAFLQEHGFHQLEEMELVEEDVRFSLPGELTHAAVRLDDNFHSMSSDSLQLQTVRFEPLPAGRAPRRAASCWRCRTRDGYWCAELTADTTLESDYILLQLWLHPPRGRSGIRPRGR